MAIAATLNAIGRPHVGQDRHAEALARPGAKPRGRPMPGYVFVDPPPRGVQARRDRLDPAIALVSTLPPRLAKSKPRPKRTG